MSTIELDMTFRRIHPDEALLTTARTAGAAMERRLETPAKWAVAVERSGERFSAEVSLEGGRIAARGRGMGKDPGIALESAFDALGRDLDRRTGSSTSVAAH